MHFTYPAHLILLDVITLRTVVSVVMNLQVLVPQS
jgi:hypothetical protein